MSSGQQSTDTLRLADIFALARETNPMLIATRFRAEAALERIPQAAAWPDPMLSLGLMNRTVRGFSASVPMSMNSVQLTQRIPWPGKPGVSQERVRRLAEAERLDSEDAEEALLARVTAVYYQLAYVDRSIANGVGTALDGYALVGLRDQKVGEANDQSPIKVGMGAPETGDHVPSDERCALPRSHYPPNAGYTTSTRSPCLRVTL